MKPVALRRRRGGEGEGGPNPCRAAPSLQATRAALKARGFDERTVEGVLAFDADQLPYELMGSLVEHIDAHMRPGAVLVFLPGWGEIQKLHELLEKRPQSSRWQLHALHGSLPTNEQRRIFARPVQTRLGLCGACS